LSRLTNIFYWSINIGSILLRNLVKYSLNEKYIAIFEIKIHITISQANYCSVDYRYRNKVRIEPVVEKLSQVENS
nr:hypothetical protein [Asgard group archaeon]